LSAQSNAQQRLWDYVPPAGLLEGKVIFVTGASRGLGRAVSLAAAGVGAETILLARSVKRLGALADEIAAAGNPEPGIIPADLEGASVDDYAEITRIVAARYGKLDGIVLNAGMLGQMAPLATYDPVSWARVFQVNVHSQFLLLQATLPLLTQSNDGSIIFTSSAVGRKSRAYWGAYAASKFAIEGMMQTLADELEGSSAVRVNSLNPGRLRTAMRAAAYPAEDPATLPEPRIAANAFLFLLGRDGSDVHGEALEAQAPTC
jgi:NAD(P)-dependent dehydrogenase (short-subunit alcohol dehydrogenase family)